jgi:hypothetical protein
VHHQQADSYDKSLQSNSCYAAPWRIENRFASITLKMKLTEMVMRNLSVIEKQKGFTINNSNFYYKKDNTSTIQKLRPTQANCPFRQTSCCNL